MGREHMAERGRVSARLSMGKSVEYYDLMGSIGLSLWHLTMEVVGDSTWNCSGGEWDE
jgi:hypothetical protein